MRAKICECYGDEVTMQRGRTSQIAASIRFFREHHFTNRFSIRIPPLPLKHYRSFPGTAPRARRFTMCSNKEVPMRKLAIGILAAAGVALSVPANAQGVWVGAGPVGVGVGVGPAWGGYYGGYYGPGYHSYAYADDDFAYVGR